MKYHPYTKLWNLSQNILEAIRQSPLDCHYWQGQKCFCSGCEPGDFFECEQCGRLRAFCQGADDRDFELCDDCWYSKNHEEINQADPIL